MKLPSPGGPLPLHLNLALVREMEERHGSLCRVAERLLANDVTFAESLKILRVAYAHAGSALDEDAIGAWLLENGPAPPVLLSELALAILEPLGEMGAIVLGEG